MTGLLLAVLLFFAREGAAEEVGASFFALNAFNAKQCDRAAAAFTGIRTVRTAILWRSFDRADGFSCLKRFLQIFNDRGLEIEVHVSNESGRAARRLSSYEFLPGLSSAALNRRLERGHFPTLQKIHDNAVEIREFFAPYARDGFKLIVSTGLEDRFSDDAFKTVYQIHREVFGYATEIFRNPVGASLNGRALFGSNGLELHGLRPDFTGLPKGRFCIQSNDGNDIDFADSGRDKSKLSVSGLSSYIERNKKRGCRTLLWTAGPQGRSGVNFVEPRARRFILDLKNIYLINDIVGKYGN